MWVVKRRKGAYGPGLPQSVDLFVTFPVSGPGEAYPVVMAKDECAWAMCGLPQSSSVHDQTIYEEQIKGTGWDDGTHHEFVPRTWWRSVIQSAYNRFGNLRF